MKKTACFLAILAILSACTGRNQKTGNNENNEQQSVDSTMEVLTEATLGKRSDIAYTQYPLAYLIEGVLYFHNFENNEKVKFIEETDPIFNFAFDPQEK